MILYKKSRLLLDDIIINNIIIKIKSFQDIE